VRGHIYGTVVRPDQPHAPDDQALDRRARGAPGDQGARTMSKIGYARVSTDDQHADVQAERLAAAGCVKVFTDQGVSGALKSRPELDRCLDYLRQDDVLVTVKLDRLGRSVKHLHEIAERLQADGIGLQCLDQPIDTTSAAGKLFFTILAAFAEFERDLIRERTRDGLAATANRGRSGGRKPKLAAYQVKHARERIEAGAAVTDVAAELGVDRKTIYRALQKPDGARDA
jgi:DNA invertase Pin-like site-specific DNA recombinase